MARRATSETFGVRLDKRSAAVANAMRRRLPSREIRAGITRVIRREMVRIRTATVRQVAPATGLKVRFLKAMTGITASAGRGVFWIVTRNFILHRLGNVERKGDGVRAKGRALKGTHFAPKAFVIGKRALRRQGRKVHTYFAATRRIIVDAFHAQTVVSRRHIQRQMHKELIYRIRRYAKSVGAR